MTFRIRPVLPSMSRSAAAAPASMPGMGVTRAVRASEEAASSAREAPGQMSVAAPMSDGGKGHTQGAGGLTVFRDGEPIDTFEDLVKSGLDFRLTSEHSEGERTYAVASYLQGMVVPVSRVGMRDVCWIFCLPRYVRNPITAEVAAEMRKSGLSLDKDFQIVVIGDLLLQQIADGRVNGSSLRQQREVERNPENSSLQKLFRNIIQWGAENGAADVDFRVLQRSDKSYVAFSIDGKWVYPERFRINTDMMLRCLSLAFQTGEGAAENGLQIQQEQQLRLHVSLPGEIGDVMLRWAALAADNVYSVTNRIVRMSQGSTLTLQQLGYLPDHLAAVKRAIRSDGGAVVFSGVVNSGKSTSLAAMVADVPLTRKIITIEDPAEIFLPNAISNTVTRPLDGSKSGQLAAKLATLKRTGFNDLLLGEIRDRETGMAAQDVIESGQKLYTTVHGAAAWKIPDRLAGPKIGIPREALASPGNLRLLVYQALLPTNCMHCARPIFSIAEIGDAAEREAGSHYIKRLERLYRADLSAVRVRNFDGCVHCRREGLPELNGLRGRTTAAEMLEPDDEFCAIVAKGDGVEMIRYLQRLRGETPYESPSMLGKSAMDCAIYKMLQGTIDPREIEPRFSTFEQIEIERDRRKGISK